MSAAVTLEILSGAPGTRGNAYVLRGAESSILLDCGEGDDAWLAALEEPTLTIVTHAHLDHVGALAGFRERFPTAPVMATPRTRASMKASLASRVGLQRATAISDTTTALRFHENFQVGEFSVMLRPAGHCPGAAMVEVSWAEGRFLYSGDISVRELRATLPTEPAGAPDWLLVEGVLAGARALEGFDADVARRELRDWLGFGGPRLLAVEGVGEGPEIAALVAQELEEGVVIHDNLVGFGVSEDLTFMNTEHARHALREGNVVIVSGAELLEGTAARILAESILSESAARIALFNGVPAGSFAQRLLRAPRRSKLREAGNQRLKARVKRFAWPLHPTPGDLERWVSESGARRIFLTHGQEGALYRLKKALDRGESGAEVHVAKVGIVALD